MILSRLLIDTNRYGDLVAHDLKVAARVHEADEVWLSLISVGELLAGFARGSRRRKNEDRLQQAIAVQGIRVLMPDFETARRYAEILSQLRRQGTPIPSNDVWIAAQAIPHEQTLDTRDEHFHHVRGLNLVSQS